PSISTCCATARADGWCSRQRSVSVGRRRRSRLAPAAEFLEPLAAEHERKRPAIDDGAENHERDQRRLGAERRQRREQALERARAEEERRRQREPRKRKLAGR